MFCVSSWDVVMPGLVPNWFDSSNLFFICTMLTDLKILHVYSQKNVTQREDHLTERKLRAQVNSSSHIPCTVTMLLEMELTSKLSHRQGKA